MKQVLLKLESNKVKQFLGAVLLIVFVAILVLSITSTINENKLIRINTYNKTTGWTLTTGDNEKAISLPYSEDVPVGTTYRLETVLNDLGSNDKQMLLRSSMQDFIVYLDDQVIHTHTKARDGSLEDIDVSMWVMVDLPNDSNNKTLRIDISSDIESFSGVVNEVRFGNESELLFGILNDSFSSIVFFVLLLVSGFLIVGLSFFIEKNTDNRIMNLGFIFLTTSIWLLSEGRVVQFLTGNRWLLSAASYTMIPLIAVFTSFYIHDAVFTTNRNKIWTRIFASYFILIFVLLVVLQVFFRVPFITTMRWTMISMVIIVLVVSLFMVEEVIKLDNRNAVRYIKYIGILFISVILETVVFFLELYSLTSVFFQMGFVVFLTLLAYDTFRYFTEGYLLEKENEILGKMVYIDQLTGGKNRAAYEYDLQMILSEENEQFRLILFDLNELKYINDTFGHQSGDTALRSMFVSIQEAFSDFGECYRLGGDEMVVIMKSIEPHTFHKCIDNLGYLLDQYSYEYKLKVAVGSDVYRSQNKQEFLDFYQKVDKKMYIDKKKLKASTT